MTTEERLCRFAEISNLALDNYRTLYEDGWKYGCSTLKEWTKITTEEFRWMIKFQKEVFPLLHQSGFATKYPNHAAGIIVIIISKNVTESLSQKERKALFAMEKKG